MHKFSRLRAILEFFKFRVPFESRTRHRNFVRVPNGKLASLKASSHPRCFSQRIRCLFKQPISLSIDQSSNLLNRSRSEKLPPVKAINRPRCNESGRSIIENRQAKAFEPDCGWSYLCSIIRTKRSKLLRLCNKLERTRDAFFREQFAINRAKFSGPC